MNARVDLDSEPSLLRIPPYSNEAESAVIGGLLMSNESFDRVSDVVTEADFYRYEHRLIYAELARLINACKPADLITVYERLQAGADGSDRVELTFLNDLAQFVPSAGNIRRYAEIVRDHAQARRLIAAADQIAHLGYDQAEPMEVRMAKASAMLDKVRDESPRDDWQGTDDGMVQLLDRIQADCDGSAPKDFVSFGLKELDDRLDGGGRPGELIVIGARPGMGKSALSLSIGVHVALNEGHPVGLFSMEMQKKQVHTRMLSMVAHIHLSRIKRPERLREFDWSSLTTGVEKLRQIPFFTSDQASLNINQVRAKARALKRRRGLRVLIVDYLGLMQGTNPKTARAYQLEEATSGLKQLAKELDITVILLAQVSREVEKRPDQMPILSDLRDSGAIEQDADVVLFVHRPIKVKPDLGKEWDYYARVSAAKVRDGEPGQFDLMYVGENTRFMNWPDDTPRPSSNTRIKRDDL